MKKLMILGAGVYQLPLIEKACQTCEVLLVAPEINEEIKKKVDKFFLFDLKEKERILETAIKENIDGIITDQTDIPVRTVAYVAEKMNLPGIGYDTACLFTDKGKMRNKLEELNIPVLPYLVTNKWEDALEFYYRYDGDVIVKPVDNQGSRGVARPETITEFKDFFIEAINNSQSKMIVVEKVARGREFVVEAMCFKNEYQELIIGDTHYFEIKNAYAAKDRVFPSEYNETVRQISELNEQIIVGFGLKQGISHSEYIMDNGQVYLLETAARGGGVFISSDLIYLRTGLETEKFLIDIALGTLKNMPIIQQKENYCGYIAFFLPEGTVVSVDGVEQVQQLEYVYRNILDTIRVGMKVKKASDKTSRFSIIVNAKNREEWFKRVENIKNILRIDVCNNREIRGIIWE